MEERKLLCRVTFRVTLNLVVEDGPLQMKVGRLKSQEHDVVWRLGGDWYKQERIAVAQTRTKFLSPSLLPVTLLLA